MPTPDMLAIGKNIPITVERISIKDPVHHPSEIVGYVQMRYLVIADMEGVLLKVGELLLIRMVTEGESVTYQVTVKKNNSDPVLYMTSFPEKVETASLRSSERVKAFISAEIQQTSETASDKTESMIVDISEGGCLFSCKSAIDEQITVSMTFSLPGSQSVIQLSGKILKVSTRSSIFSHRVRFDDIEENTAARATIKNWIDEYSIYAIE